MSATDNPTNNPTPTEEIYLELQELRAAAAELEAEQGDALPKIRDDDPSDLKARIARLRAMLMDRGAAVDE